MSRLHFLIIDGYAKDSRQHFTDTGAQLAWEQYQRMVLAHVLDAKIDVLFPSDPDAALPAGVGIGNYQGILWTGCNLTIFDQQDSRVATMIELAGKIFELGVPAYGSCWALQIAVVAAGGMVRANPRGREMGLARKIRLLPASNEHPFYRGKPAVFDAFISHYDEVSQLPPGTSLLASNDFTEVQALALQYRKGTFWAVQYHPEYDLYDMARLIVAREDRLVKEGFFANSQDLAALVARMEALSQQPERMDLRWQLGIDDDVLDQSIRQLEFRNWVDYLVIPTAAGHHD